jgi:hypothetical protein
MLHSLFVHKKQNSSNPQGCEQASIATQPERPYPPSWFNRLQEYLERLPGPVWLFYLLLALGLVIIHAAIKWCDGAYPVGTFHPFHVVVMVSGVWFLASIHYLNRAASRALDRFRPAFAANQQTIEEVEYRLTTLPATPTRWVTVAGILYGAIVVIAIMRGVVFDPSVLVFTSRLATQFESLIGLFVCTTFVLFLYHTSHQTCMVSTIYAHNTTIDLFNLTPIHAFSVLTAQTAISVMPLISAWVATEPGALGDEISLATMTIAIALSLVAFLWPLLGIHGRLAAKKRQVLSETGQRIKRVLAEMHWRVDTELTAELQGTMQALTALQQEQALLEKIPTWPWQTSTVQTLVTAVLLPIALWVVTHLLERVLSF